MQRLALVLEQSGQVIYSLFFATEARRLSGGHVNARLVEAWAFWRGRLINQVLGHAYLARLQARRVRPRANRVVLQAVIVRLHVLAAYFTGDAVQA